MTERTIGYWACAAPLWVVFVTKLVGLRKARHDPMRRAVCATVFSCAAILTASAPDTIGAVNEVTGVPNLAFVVNFSLVIVLAASVRVLIVYWQEPNDRATTIAKRWIAGYCVVVLGMAGLFWLGSAPVERRTDFETYYATTPYIAQFVLLYLGAQALAMVSVIRGCVRWARLTDDPWLRRGLHLITFGSVCGLGVSGLRGLAMAARWCDGNWDALNTRASVACAMAGLTFGAIGFALPAWADLHAHARSWLSTYRSHRALYPLWDALRTSVPSIVLPARIPWWNPHLRLTRRLAEINDGRLALRPSADQRVARRALDLGRAADLSPSDLAATVEAALLKGALAARQSGTPTPDVGAPPPDPLLASEAPADLGELEWLTRVSRAFTDSPVVAQASRPEERAPVEERGGRLAE